MQKPILLTLDEPTQKAKEMLSEYVTFSNSLKSEFSMIYTQFTPIECSNYPVFCPCTGIEHLKNVEKVFYLDDEWKNGNGKFVTSTAEHAFSLILQLAKLKKMQLSGKVLGLVGVGRLGKLMIRYGKAFNMAVIANDNKTPVNGLNRKSLIYKINPGYNIDLAMHNLDYVLRNSDIISLHVPLNDTTRGMIGKEQFDMMRPGTLLINTSRAEIVDKDALISSLYTAHLGGYADDFKDRHINHHNVMQTPHIGGNCHEAREMTDCYIASKIISYIKGEIS